jgi:hypothetical protein
VSAYIFLTSILCFFASKLSHVLSDTMYCNFWYSQFFCYSWMLVFNRKAGYWWGSQGLDPTELPSASPGERSGPKRPTLIEHYKGSLTCMECGIFHTRVPTMVHDQAFLLWPDYPPTRGNLSHLLRLFIYHIFLCSFPIFC